MIPNLVNEYNFCFASTEANGNPANNVDKYKYSNNQKQGNARFITVNVRYITDVNDSLLIIIIIKYT